MSEADDTKSNAGEPAAKPRGGVRAAAHPGEAFEFANDAARPSPADASPVDASPTDASPVDAPAAAVNSSAAGSSSIAAPDAPCDPQHASHVAPGVEPLVLQPDFQAGDKSQYHVGELLAYHDRHFVENVYRAILGRAPHPAEGARELEELRGGRAGKIEIIERLSASPEARAGSRRRVKIEGLPSPVMRRLGRVPFVGYALRLVRALVRLPVSMQHQRQFEIYALAQQQLIADYLNRTLPQFTHESADAGDAPPASVAPPSQQDDIAETLAMFSDALLELSNSHAELQAQTQTQAEQAQAALTELTAAVTAQQQLAETVRREQQLAADAQQEFLIQEQRVIVETQQVVLEELREELRALSERQQRAREEFDAEMRRLRSLRETAAARENFSGQA
jgi:hypothetical protein